MSCLGSDLPYTASGVAQGFGLIPVGSAGETVGVVSEVAGEEKIGGNGVRRNIQQRHDQ